MPGATQNAADRQTDVKTEILPAYISEETAVRTGDAYRPEGAQAVPLMAVPRTSSNRRFLFAAVAGLIIVGCAAFGAAVYSPGMFSSSTPQSGPQTEQPAVVPAANAAQPEGEQSGVGSGSETAGGVGRSAEPKPEAERPQTKQTAKSTGKNAANSDVSDVADPDLGDLKGKTIVIGNMKIKDGRVETPDAIYDENGVTPKTPNGEIPIPPVQPGFRGLTPKQRRQLQMLRRRVNAHPNNRLPDPDQ